MHVRFALFSCLLASTAFAATEGEIYAGPHFNYVRLEFNNPSDLQGYEVGVTAGASCWSNWFYGNVQFEGSWNAGPFTGDPCQKSELTEYFLELKLGGTLHWDDFSLQPYTGFGWDRLENLQDPNSARLLYEYDKLFIPIGFTFFWELWEAELGLQFEWTPDVYGNLELLGIDLDPDWAYGYRVELPFQKFYKSDSIPGWFTLAVVPFFDWNKFGKIEEATCTGATLEIPRLVRWSLGLRALVGYQF